VENYVPKYCCYILLLISFNSKKLCIEEFSRKFFYFCIHTFNHEKQQIYGSKKVPQFKFMLLKNYLAEIDEIVISGSRVLAGKNKKKLVKILISCRDTAI
jgi:hypothetical protein